MERLQDVSVVAATALAELQLREQDRLDPILFAPGPVVWDPPAFLLKLSTGHTIEVPASPPPEPTPWVLEPMEPAPAWYADLDPAALREGVVWWGPLRPALPPELEEPAFGPADKPVSAATT